MTGSGFLLHIEFFNLGTTEKNIKMGSEEMAYRWGGKKDRKAFLGYSLNELNDE